MTTTLDERDPMAATPDDLLRLPPSEREQWRRLLEENENLRAALRPAPSGADAREPSEYPPLDENEVVSREDDRAFRVAVQACDRRYQADGAAGTKTWFRDYFVPELAKQGFRIRRALSSEGAPPEPGVLTRATVLPDKDRPKALRDFGRAWKLDGDLLVCRSCGRALHVSRAGERLHHAGDCTKDKMAGHPWSALQFIVGTGGWAAAPSGEREP